MFQVLIMFKVIIMFQVLMLNLIHKHDQNKIWLKVGSENSKTISMSALKNRVSQKYFHPASILTVFLQ